MPIIVGTRGVTTCTDLHSSHHWCSSVSRTFVMKKIVLTILCILYCSPVHALVNRPNHISFDEVTIWIMIPDEDDVWVYCTSIERDKGGGLIFLLEESGLYVEQNIAAIADPTEVFAVEIGDIIDAHLMIYLDFENGWDKFKTLGKITKMEGY